MRTEVAIGPDTAARMARASTRYRLGRPAFWVPIAVELALAVVFAAAGHPGWGVVLVVVALLGPVLLRLQTPTLARAMARRGYRSGTTMTVDWDDDTFTVSTPDGSGTHHYHSATGARLVDGAVGLRIRGARVLLLLPADVVPDAVRPRLGLRP